MIATLLADITQADLLRNLVSGFALGCKYALVALGFVIVFKATGVINFAQASFVLLGGYLTFNASETWGLNFYLALLVAMAGGALLGMAVEALVLRRMIGEAPFTLVMVTIGLLFVLDNGVTAIWGPDAKNLGDPWGLNIRTVGDVADRGQGHLDHRLHRGRDAGLLPLLPLLLARPRDAGHRARPGGGPRAGHQRRGGCTRCPGASPVSSPRWPVPRCRPAASASTPASARSPSWRSRR